MRINWLYHIWHRMYENTKCHLFLSRCMGKLLPVLFANDRLGVVAPAWERHLHNLFVYEGYKSDQLYRCYGTKAQMALESCWAHAHVHQRCKLLFRWNIILPFTKDLWKNLQSWKPRTPKSWYCTSFTQSLKWMGLKSLFYRNKFRTYTLW